jgi:hypothetical protein
MIKIHHLFFPAILFVFFAATSAMALGIGAYFEAAGGEGYRKVRSSSLESTGGTASGYGFRAGLIFDTCVACDDVFSYRLKIGGGTSWTDLVSATNYNSFHMSHTFAFAAVKNDIVKFWIGPQIGIRYRRGNSDRLFFGTELPGTTYAMLNAASLAFPYYQYGAFKERTKQSLFGANAGIAFGTNLNLGDYVTLALEAGVTYGYDTGRQEREVYWAGNPIVAFNKFKHEKVIEHGVEGYGSIAFMFRFADTYQ